MREKSLLSSFPPVFFPQKIPIFLTGGLPFFRVHISSLRKVNLVVTFPADRDYISLAVGRDDRQRQLGIFLHAKNMVRDLRRAVSVFALADLTLLLLVQYSVGDSAKLLGLIKRREIVVFDKPFEPIQIFFRHCRLKNKTAVSRGGRINIMLRLYYTPRYGRTTVIFSLMR